MAIDLKERKKNSDTLIYPSNLDEAPPLQMLITPMRIKRGGVLKGIGGTAGDIISKTLENKSNEIIKFKTIISKFNILLPIPNNFSTVLTHNWNEINTYYYNVKSTLQMMAMNKLTSGGGATGLQPFLAGEGLSGYEPKTSQYKDTAQLEFPFEWKFTPQSESESKVVGEIIKVFQMGSMPQGVAKTDSSGVLRAMRAPYLWKLQFIPFLKNAIGADKKQLKNFYFKDNTLNEMILTQVTTNHTPDGDFYPFPNGMPSSLSLSLNFRMSRNILSYSQIFGKASDVSDTVNKLLFWFEKKYQGK